VDLSQNQNLQIESVYLLSPEMRAVRLLDLHEGRALVLDFQLWCKRWVNQSDLILRWSEVTQAQRALRKQVRKNIKTSRELLIMPCVVMGVGNSGDSYATHHQSSGQRRALADQPAGVPPGSHGR
jgi:hypothetical protein